ncbi:MAG: SDR family NAD(P)-dependent oxidoreductase [Planctomycetes bacterium]|nr:SDR family NAD(P)-dependent oxidoreductase [Planctomycetota bacterium]
MSQNQIATQPPLAIVGLSALFPKAENLDQFWSNIRRGVDAIIEVPDTHWNPDDYFDSNQKSPDMTYARRGGFLSPMSFDPLEYGISPNNLEAIDTSQLLGMVGAKRALEHAGYGAGRQFDRSRVGCILGVTGTLEMVIPLGARLGHPLWRKALKDAGVPEDVANDVVQRISESYVPWQENSFPGLLGNVVAGRIANRLDLHGTNCVVDAACASSLSAIHLAALELWTGRSDMVVTGGIDTFNDIFMFMCFSKTPALSPSGDSKPFSDSADGTILGEGVGIVVLKRLADAERDGDRIFAVLKGIGTSSDGAGNAVYAPKAEGQIRCLQDAYRVAGVTPDTIELVEAHGTGTKVGDATEVTGLMHVFKATGRPGPWCAVGSIKSQIGHTKAAAGAAGIIKAILALQHRVLPPTIKVNQPPAPLLTDDSPFYVNTEARPWLKPNGYPRRAAVSAFGFGGSNFHCVLEESPQRFDDPDWDGDLQIVAISATDLPQLSSVLQTWAEPSEWPSIRSRAIASRALFRRDHAHRLLFVIERHTTDTAKLVTSAFTMLDKYAERSSWSTPDGVYYGRGPAPGRLGILFPGQGSQYLGMLRELACRFPVMNDVLTEANDVFSARVDSGHRSNSKKLSDFVYPPPSWSQAVRDERDSQLRATQIAQPALGAISLGALAVLEQFGVHPEAAAGHSYGELTALCASRRFAPKTLYRLSMLRGQLMAEAQEVDGGMLAVGAPLTQVEAAIREMAVDLVVANYNSPNQVVLSGRIPEIDRATELFSRQNLRGKKLQVAAAFHSPLVATASRAFRPELEDVEFAPSQMPVYANSTAREYPADPGAARDLLASQLARPVNFVNEIEQMYADGVRTFLEVGPGGVLTGLVNSILSGREFRAIALDSSNGRRGGLFDLAHALAQLSASGHSVRLDAWDPSSRTNAESTPSNRLRIPISGANYVKPRTPRPPRPPMNGSTVRDDQHSQPPVMARQDLISGDSPAALVESPRIPPAPSPLPDLRAVDSVPAPLAAIPSAPAQASIPMDSFSATGSFSEEWPSVDDLEMVQNHLQTLQQMQEKTARLHQLFLESQEAALRTFEELARRQIELSARRLAPVPAAPTISVPAPVSVPIPVRPEPFRTSVSDAINGAAIPPVVQVPTPTVSVAPSLPAAPVSPAPAPVPVVSSALSATVLAVVSEKTGYPTEMLILGMSLDHDLGIDSIKRVEILSALQERVPNLPAFKPDELGSLHTLLDVVTLAEARNAEQNLNGMTAVVPAAPPTASPTPVQTIAPTVTTATSALTNTVLAVVSEKTGYPTEMLNLGMSLDHDLGIDSIKRVEILSALQERVPDLPAFKPDELGSLHTLTDVITLAESRHSQNAVSPVSVPPVASIPAPAPVSAPVQPTPAAPAATSSLASTVLIVVSEKTGYPTEMLNLGMSLDHDLGIDSIKRVEILSALQERVPDLPAFQPEELGALHTLNDVVTLAEARHAKQGANRASAIPPASVAVAAPAATATLTPVQQPVAIPAATSSLTSTVLAVVSEKTGYPTEMLNLEMSLDHDLGIDSIKRVEILSALQERVPNLPAFKPEELGSLHTLSDVVTLAESRHSAGPPNSSAVPVPLSTTVNSPPPSEAVQPRQIQNSPYCTQPATLVRSVVRTEQLPPASASPELPIVRGAEIWITEDGLELSLRIATELSLRGFKPRVVNLDEPFVSALPERLAGLIVVASAEGTNDRQLWRAIEWLQKAGPVLKRTAALGTSVFATVSRLDGHFGFAAGQSLADPLSGGFAGLTKSAAREWPELTCKAFDLSNDWPSASETAVRLVDELFRQGPVEIGLSPAGRCTPTVVEESLNSFPATAAPIHQGDLVIVSGGARGVTAAAAVAVAQAWQARLVILGRSPVPSDEPAWLQRLTTEREIKQGLIENLPRGTLPKAIESQYRQILAGREVTTNLSRMRAAGVSVSYHAVDIRDLATVRTLLLQLQKEYGPVRGMIHGAGVLADQRIEDKTHEQFDRVYQTKVGGLRNLLGAIDPAQLRVLCLFSSYTARYGRIGQCDYAIANEVLNKLGRKFSLEHRQTQVVSFNWGPWDGGMVTGGLKTLFASEQVGLIPMSDGASLLVQEFSQTGSQSVEVLVLGRYGDSAASTNTPTSKAPQPAPVDSVPNLPAPVPLTVADRRESSNILVAGSPGNQGSSNVLFAANSAESARSAVPSVPLPQQGSSNVLLSGSIPAAPLETPPPAPGPSGSWVFAEIGQTSGSAADLKVAFERTIDVSQYPFLESHVIGGKAVLPVAIIMEWLAHGAIHHNPGLELEGFDDFRVFHGVRMDRQEELNLKVLVGRPVRTGGRFVVRTQLVGSAAGRELIHAGGNAILSSQYPTCPDAQLQVAKQGYSLDMATAYATKLFHGSHLQGIAAVEACSRDGIVVDSRTSPAPWAWMREPLRHVWIADPLSIDAALQAVILWTQEIQGMPCLPCSISSYRQFRKVFPHTGVKIVVRVTQATEHTIRADIEFLDLQGTVVALMTGCESIADASLVGAFKRNRLA